MKRVLFLPAVIAHSLYCLVVLAGLMMHDLVHPRRWIPETSTLWLLALGGMIAAPVLFFLIMVFQRPGSPEDEGLRKAAMREKARRRMKRVVAVVAITFLAGGFLSAAYGMLQERFEILLMISVGLMGCAVGLFFIAAPWIALYSVWFEADPS